MNKFKRSWLYTSQIEFNIQCTFVCTYYHTVLIIKFIRFQLRLKQQQQGALYWYYLLTVNTCCLQYMYMFLFIFILSMYLWKVIDELWLPFQKNLNSFKFVCDMHTFVVCTYYGRKHYLSLVFYLLLLGWYQYQQYFWMCLCLYIIII